MQKKRKISKNVTGPFFQNSVLDLWVIKQILKKIKGRKRTTGNGDINIETPENSQSRLSLVIKQSTL